MMTEMDDAYRQDSREERLLRDAVRALDDLENVSRLHPDAVKDAKALRGRLSAIADHIVAVWD